MEQSKYLVSTVIPVYNVGEILHRTLNSLICQSNFESVEVILIDDGSTDCSGKICDEYVKKYNNFKVFHEKNHGVSYARNLGLGSATGEYIHFMDSDDLLEKSMYEEFFEICKNAKPDILIGGVKRITLKPQYQSVKLGYDKKTILRGQEEKKQFFKDINTEDERWVLDYIWNKFFKRDFVLSNQLHFDESISLGEDFGFNCSAFISARSIYLTDQIIYNYFIRDTGLVTNFHEKPWFFREKLNEQHIKLYRSMRCLDKERIHSINMYEGALAFGALRSVNNKRCYLNNKEKRAHIEGMISSNIYDQIIYFCDNSKGVKYKIFYLLLAKKSKIGIKIVLAMDWIYRLKKIY